MHTQAQEGLRPAHLPIGRSAVDARPGIKALRERRSDPFVRAHLHVPEGGRMRG
jgi:hypothetical protein